MKCVICVCYRGASYKVKPKAPWPKNKVREESPAFKHTGLDYFEPLHFKQNKETNAVWVCMFSCITVRAMNLELVEDITE